MRTNILDIVRLREINQQEKELDFLLLFNKLIVDYAKSPLFLNFSEPILNNCVLSYNPFIQTIAMDYTYFESIKNKFLLTDKELRELITNSTIKYSKKYI